MLWVDNMEEKDAKKKVEIPYHLTTAGLAVVVVILVGLLLTSGFLSTSDSQIGSKVTTFVNENFLIPRGLSANLEDAQPITGHLYQVDLNIEGSDEPVPFYVTKDGQYLIFPDGLIDMDEYNSISTGQTDIPKTDKPVVQLFVMSFCPYGTQAEAIIEPVIALLGDKITFEPHFIVSVSGDQIQSLHGQYEVDENIRQACVFKYNKDKWWTYVNYINEKCFSSNLDICWKESANQAGLDVASIETCFNDEGFALMQAESDLSNKNGVSGSPTLIINGVTYSGARTTEAYKDAICSAFNTEPSECAQEITATTTSEASGSC